MGSFNNGTPENPEKKVKLKLRKRQPNDLDNPNSVHDLSYRSKDSALAYSDLRSNYSRVYGEDDVYRGSCSTYRTGIEDSVEIERAKLADMTATSIEEVHRCEDQLKHITDVLQQDPPRKVMGAVLSYKSGISVSESDCPTNLNTQTRTNNVPRSLILRKSPSHSISGSESATVYPAILQPCGFRALKTDSQNANKVSGINLIGEKTNKDEGGMYDSGSCIPKDDRRTNCNITSKSRADSSSGQMSSVLSGSTIEGCLPYNSNEGSDSPRHTSASMSGNVVTTVTDVMPKLVLRKNAKSKSEAVICPPLKIPPRVCNHPMRSPDGGSESTYGLGLLSGRSREGIQEDSHSKIESPRLGKEMNPGSTNHDANIDGGIAHPGVKFVNVSKDLSTERERHAPCVAARRSYSESIHSGKDTMRSMFYETQTKSKLYTTDDGGGDAATCRSYSSERFPRVPTQTGSSKQYISTSCKSDGPPSPRLTSRTVPLINTNKGKGTRKSTHEVTYRSHGTPCITARSLSSAGGDHKILILRKLDDPLLRKLPEDQKSCIRNLHSRTIIDQDGNQWSDSSSIFDITNTIEHSEDDGEITKKTHLNVHDYQIRQHLVPNLDGLADKCYKYTTSSAYRGGTGIDMELEYYDNLYSSSSMNQMTNTACIGQGNLKATHDSMSNSQSPGGEADMALHEPYDTIKQSVRTNNAQIRDSRTPIKPAKRSPVRRKMDDNDIVKSRILADVMLGYDKDAVKSLITSLEERNAHLSGEEGDLSNSSDSHLPGASIPPMRTHTVPSPLRSNNKNIAKSAKLKKESSYNTSEEGLNDDVIRQSIRNYIEKTLVNYTPERYRNKRSSAVVGMSIAQNSDQDTYSDWVSNMQNTDSCTDYTDETGRYNRDLGRIGGVLKSSDLTDLPQGHEIVSTDAINNFIMEIYEEHIAKHSEAVQKMN